MNKSCHLSFNIGPVMPDLVGIFLRLFLLHQVIYRKKLWPIFCYLLDSLSHNMVIYISTEIDDFQTGGTLGIFPKLSCQAGCPFFRFPGSTENRSRLTKEGDPVQLSPILADGTSLLTIVEGSVYP